MGAAFALERANRIGAPPVLGDHGAIPAERPRPHRRRARRPHRERAALVGQHPAPRGRPGGIEHGVTVHTETEIIDVFSPARDDYR